VVHQEGLIGLLAVVCLLLSEQPIATSLSPRPGLALAALVGLAAGASIAACQWLLRKSPPLKSLERCLKEMVGHWSLGDALAVALLSGLAEEALLRALLQPLIGLFPAAGLFALLHIFPDRRAWAWPIIALAIGVALGWLFELHGYPAAATAHVVINAIGLTRLSREAARSAQAEG
jgi:membrane protease YdiL (CAAX protease family)